MNMYAILNSLRSIERELTFSPHQMAVAYVRDAIRWIEPHTFPLAETNAIPSDDRAWMEQHKEKRCDGSL